MTELKLAIVGCGNISHAHAGGLLELSDLIQPVALCDPNNAAADRLASKFPGRALKRLQTVEAVADDDSIQAAIVTLPHHAHFAAVKALLEADKHVLIEKPFAMNAKEAAALARLAKQRGVALVVGHCQRHSPAGKALKTILDRDELGPVFGVNATALQYLPHYMSPDSGHWLYSAEQAGGGIVISVCVHKLDLFRFLFGEVASVTAQLETDADRGSDDRPFEWTAAINLKFESGAVGNLFTSYKAYSDIWEPETLLVLCERGTVRAIGWEELQIASRALPDWASGFHTHRPQAENEWAAQLRAFHATATRGEPNPADAADAVRTMALIDAIYLSGQDGGRPVTPEAHAV